MSGLPIPLKLFIITILFFKIIQFMIISKRDVKDPLTTGIHLIFYDCLMPDDFACQCDRQVRYCLFNPFPHGWALFIFHFPVL